MIPRRAGVAWLLLMAGTVYAAPQGGEIISGRGQIEQDAAGTTLVTQDSASLAIDWQGFDVAAGEQVRFQQPGREAAVLNRIWDQKPSEIFGRIDANGRVFLLNPNGILFGPGARVNVGSLIAGSLSMDADAFSRGDYRLDAVAGQSAGAVINRGVINAASGGSVSLLGGTVSNEGRIIAEYGQINLASGSRAYLSFDGARLLNFSVGGDAQHSDAASVSAVANSGTLAADGGTVLMSAHAAREVFSNVVNNEGIIRANRIENIGGVVTLVGSGGNIVHRGEIDVRSQGPGSGGDVTVGGERVGILGNASIDASGATGGGTIIIGDESTALTQIADAAVIRADANQAGDGGEIRVWANDSTWAYGLFSARGGSLSGDGGLVDISAARGLVFSGRVDLTAARGNFGTLLFDPTDIIIHDQAEPPSPLPQPDDGLLPDLSDATRGPGSFNIGELALEGLANNANLILEASNDITVNDLGDNKLALAIDSTGTLTMTADSDGDGTGDFSMNSGDTIATAGAGISIAASNITAGTLSTDVLGTDGAINLTASGSISMGAANAGSQSISATVDDDNNGAETLTVSGTLTASGGITLQGGSNGGDTLIGPNGNNSWTITALNTGTLNGANFSGFTGLTGGSGDDAFAITGIGSISGIIDGGGHVAGDVANYSGSTGIVKVTLGTSVTNIEQLVGGGADNTLIGANVVNDWTITGQNDGTVAGVNFTDFSNLSGGTAADRFVLSNGSVTGTVSGGGGNDSLTANNGSNTWSLLTADGGNVDGVFAFSDIDTLIGGSGQDIFILNGGSVSGQIDGGGGIDSLTANDVANTWNITGADAGNVGGVNDFISIENLNGKSAGDDFLFAGGGSISGTVNGSSGVDTVNLSALSDPVVADLSGSDYANIESFTGNNSDSTLIGPATQNNWIISGSNDGTVGSIIFTDFTSLQGGGDIDNFTLSSGGALTGTIDGGGGSDNLAADNTSNTWDLSGLDSGQLNGMGFSSVENLSGNATDDSFIFADGSGISGTVDGQGGADTVDFSLETGSVDVLLGFAGFNNIETFIGNDGDSRITGEAAQNDWSITGANSGSINVTTAFSGFNHLSGNTGDDTFTLNGGSISGTINGGGGNDTLIADSGSNTWNITGADSGNVSGVTAYLDIDNLTGNSASDTFTFTDGSSQSGIVNGAAGSDTVDHSAQSGAVNVSLDGGAYVSIEFFVGNGANSTLLGDDVATNWTITGNDSGSVDSIGFSNFSSLAGGSGQDNFSLAGGSLSGTISGGGGSDELVGDDTSNTWNITSAEVGTLNGQNAFSSIERLSGGGVDDTFVYADGSSFSGGVDGGAGVDVVDMSAQTGAVSIVLGSNSFTNVESYIGNNIASTITGAFSSNSWLITANNGGTVNGIGFSGFNNLQGNIQSDDFVVNAGGISGNIDGGQGNDSLTASAVANTWNITGVDTGNVDNVTGFSDIENLVGNSGTDIFVFGNTSDISGSVDGGAGSDTVDFSAEAGAVSVLLGQSGFNNIENFIGNDIDSTFAGPAVSNNWQIVGNNDGIVGGVSFSNFNNLTGNVSSDTFAFADGSTITGRVDGGAGLDSADFSAQTGAVTVQLGGSGYSNIETFIGNNSASTIIGDAVSNDWLITGPNDGSLGGINFSDFNQLLGNTDTDNFILNGGSISTSVNGGGGTDSIVASGIANVWNITGIDSGNINGIAQFSSIENLQGNLDVDSFIFADGAGISGVVDGAAGNDSVDHSAQSGAIAITLGTAAYTNIETYLGNNINSTLTGPASANSWTISGANSGTVGTIAFNGFTNLAGNVLDDTFSIDGGSITGGIDGGAGTDSVIADTGVNTWNITGVDTGDVSGVGSFVNIEKLLGNSDSDTFVFANGAAFSGLIDGAGGEDQVDQSSQLGTVQINLGSGAYASIEEFVGNNTDSTLAGANIANNWTISAPNAGDVNGIRFLDFNNLNGSSSVDVFTLAGGSIAGQINGGGGNDTLIADNVANTWSVTAQDSGNVSGVSSFVAIDNLTGGALADAFNVGSQLTGNINGGSGDDVIRISGSAVVDGIISGGAGTDTLIGPDAASTWNISGTNAGDLNASSFQGMENISGGSAADSFLITNSNASSLSGTISAGAGDDVLNIDYSAASTRTVTFDGEGGSDTVLVTGGGSSFDSNVMIGTSSQEASLLATSTGSTQTVVTRNVEAVQDTLTADSLTLQGSSADNDFQLDAASLSGTSPLRITIASLFPYETANKGDVSIIGGTGTDSLVVAGDSAINGNLNIELEQVSDPAGARITADGLVLNQIAQGGTSALPLITSVNRLAITGDSGNVFVRESDDVLISAENITGSLEVESQNGDITSNGSIAVSGSSKFNVADGRSIALNDANNTFSLTPVFASTGTIANLDFSNTRAIAIQPLTLSGDLSLTVNGDITQSGPLNIGGQTMLDAGSHAIDLTNTNNLFTGPVSLHNAGNHNVVLTTSAGLDLGTSTLGSGRLTVNAEGVSQSGSITQAAGAGPVSIDAGSAALSLTNGSNDFTGVVSLYGAGSADLALTDANQLQLGTTTSQGGGSIDIEAGNDVAMSGTLQSNGGDVSITSTSGDIELGRIRADSGTIALDATAGAITGNNSPITDPNLAAQNLELNAGSTIGSFNNPIAVNVPQNGTSLFVAGQGSAHIIGLPGQILDGSVRVNNVSATIGAVGQSLVTTILDVPPFYLTDDYRYRLFAVTEGGVRLPAQIKPAK